MLYFNRCRLSPCSMLHDPSIQRISHFWHQNLSINSFLMASLIAISFPVEVIWASFIQYALPPLSCRCGTIPDPSVAFRSQGCFFVGRGQPTSGNPQWQRRIWPFECHIIFSIAAGTAMIRRKGNSAVYPHHEFWIIHGIFAHSPSPSFSCSCVFENIATHVGNES